MKLNTFFKKQAHQFDQKDPLRKFRSEFIIPKSKNKKEQIYFCGNSLGLQPKSVQKELNLVLKDWGNFAVEGHFKAKTPWLSYHETVTQSLANLVGAQPNEVVAMNTLTVNLHLLMVSFYRPRGKKCKIIIEGGAFPSDQYAVHSQLRYHGVDPKEGLIELLPRENESTLRTEDIISVIQKYKEECALVLLGNVNYLTGQAFQVKEISKAVHECGAFFILDLAHGIGNVEFELHQHEVDAATWCSYKYLNSGPGGISGIFVHEKHLNNPTIPRFEGWWGTSKKNRFLMKPEFEPIPSAEAWQLSNPPIFQLCSLRESLKIFDRARLKNLRKKSMMLTSFLEQMLTTFPPSSIKILTPSLSQERGAQLSLELKNAKKIQEKLIKENIIVDYREPGIIRVAPAPLYNRFMDCFRFYEVIEKYV